MKRRILQLFAEGMKPSEIDEAMKLDQGTAHEVVLEAWKERKEVSRPPKYSGPTKRIPPELVRQIRAAKWSMTLKEAGKKFGVSPAAVGRIWHGESYREVQ